MEKKRINIKEIKTENKNKKKKKNITTITTTKKTLMPGIVESIETYVP